MLAGCRISRQALARRKDGSPTDPVSMRRLISHAQMRLGNERVAPIRDWAFLGIAIEIAVAFAEKPESIFVKSEPYVQAVLFNATCRSTTGCALPSNPPSHLVHGHAVLALMERT